MHYGQALHRISCLCCDPPMDSRVTFVSPIVSTMLAAALNNPSLPVREKITFGSDAQSYADNCGLTAAIQNQYEFPKRSGRQGSTYTKLTRLSSHYEVDLCNAIINDLIFEHFEHFGPVAVNWQRLSGNCTTMWPHMLMALAFLVHKRTTLVVQDGLSLQSLTAGAVCLRTCSEFHRTSIRTQKRSVGVCSEAIPPLVE